MKKNKLALQVLSVGLIILSFVGTMLHGNNTTDETKRVYLEIYYTDQNNLKKNLCVELLDTLAIEKPTLLL